MQIEIYELISRNGERILDIDRKVAVISVQDGAGSFLFCEPSREKTIKRLFDGPAVVFVAGATTGDNKSIDAVETYPAWSREAVDHILNEKLLGFNLSGRIV